MTVTTDTPTGRLSVLTDVKALPSAYVAQVRKQAFAYAGLADLALEQAKEVPAELSTQAEKVSAAVRTLPTQVKGLRGEVETRVAKAQESATDLYAQLAVRGERLVTQIRRQPATEAAIDEGKEAVKKAEAAAVAAKNSVKAGEKAARGAAAKLG
jgi:DNA polymerase II small subunit/DNA polymerase delta subunit B